jgi:hypothetical protein
METLGHFTTLLNLGFLGAGCLALGEKLIQGAIPSMLDCWHFAGSLRQSSSCLLRCGWAWAPPYWRDSASELRCSRASGRPKRSRPTS